MKNDKKAYAKSIRAKNIRAKNQPKSTTEGSVSLTKSTTNANVMVEMPQHYPNALDFHSGEGKAENIKVVVRVRPLNITEIGRGDAKSIEYMNNNSMNFSFK